MKTKVNRETVDLTGYPDLVVIYLGMRVKSLRGLKSVISIGPKIQASVDAKPEGLLLHENILFGLFPLHVGMRQYWHDFESMERWSRSLPHQAWWKAFLKDSGGTGFWHETYFMRGGMEAIYDDIPHRVGLAQFAPVTPARGPMFSSRGRLKLPGEPESPAPITESEES